MESRLVADHTPPEVAPAPPGTTNLTEPPRADGAGSFTVLVVEVDGTRCGFFGRDVIEVHRVVYAAPVSGAPDLVEGVINVRGAVVAVIDLRVRLGLRRRPPILSDHLVLVRVETRVMALRVDRAVDLITVADDAIHRGGPDVGGNHLAGVAVLPDGLLLIQNLDSFLSAEEGAVLDAALAEHAPPERS